MQKIDPRIKREIDSEITGQLLKITKIRDELMAYTNRFLEKFHTDTYGLLGILPIHQLCSISVKGGLGLVNLEAQIQQPASDILVWNDYVGDCDLNLIINQQHFPTGKTTGEVMAAVARRIKILLAETIEETRYSTLVEDIQSTLVRPPLYRCNQVEALAHIVDFISQDLNLPIELPNVVAGNITDLSPIMRMIKDIMPGLVEIGGQNLQRVFDVVIGGETKSNDWIVIDDRENNLLFVSNLNQVKSSWTDVDYSFFPYAPGLMDSLGYEINELAIAQQKARQPKKVDFPYPYDVFKIANTPFVFTRQSTTNDDIDPHEDTLFQPTDSYCLSMYANNLIDDFALIRTALRFYGYALRRKDVQATPQGNRTYRLDVQQGSGKCEFVDVAIPRIASPEWFYCQNRHYYITIPNNPPAGSWAFKVCNFDYQVEENVNLLIELGCGLSHSAHKAAKRINRLGQTWIRCNFQSVFPRGPNAALPQNINAPFDAPASLVTNFTNDYLNLFGTQQLPDWLYNEIFVSLYELKHRVDIYNNAQQPTNQQIDDVTKSAKKLGSIGILEIQCMADVVDGPYVANLRGLLESGHIKVNWALAAYLLLKESQISDVIWFPRIGIFEVVNPVPVTNEFQDIATNGAALAAGDYVAVTWDAEALGTPLTFFTLPGADVLIQGAPNPPVFYGTNLETAERKLYSEIRNRLMRANNQMLRVSYGTILNCLARTAGNVYMSDVL